jgi:acyl-CoA hydrolase
LIRSTSSTDQGRDLIPVARDVRVFQTSLEVEVEVFSEAIQTGERKLTSKAYLTFVF